MSVRMVTELYAPRGRLSLDVLTFTLQVLLQAGFRFGEPPTSQEVQYWAEKEKEWRGPVPLDEAMHAFPDSTQWGIGLYKERLDGQATDLTLSVYRASPNGGEFFDRLVLSTWLSHFEVDAMFSQEFLSWATFLAELTNPWYGWGGSELGLSNREATRPSQADILHLKLQPIEWLNIYGEGYVHMLGLSRLFSTPAWRVEFLANRCIAVTLAEHPYGVSNNAAGDIARHLGEHGPSS